MGKRENEGMRNMTRKYREDKRNDRGTEKIERMRGRESSEGHTR